jgi:hypothetical protein
VLWCERLPAGLWLGSWRFPVRMVAYGLLVLGFVFGFVLFVDKFARRMWVS